MTSEQIAMRADLLEGRRLNVMNAWEKLFIENLPPDKPLREWAAGQLRVTYASLGGYPKRDSPLPETPAESLCSTDTEGA